MVNEFKTTAFSAPGKALLAGGYLVLLPQYSAYVVALSARIHAVVCEDHNRSNTTNPTITTRSPQFNHGEWIYSLGNLSDDIYISPVLKSLYGNNPFLEAAIRTVLAYSFASGSRKLNRNITITIYSDDAYHSQIDRIDHINGNNTTTKKRFHYHSKSIRDVPKTGLGSSAALTTSVTAALLSFYLNSDPCANLDIVHNLAQLAHCTAQKKVGSGFDIASAVYGSVQYGRFPSETIPNELFTPESIQPPEKFPTLVKNLIDSNWKMTHSSCSLPPGLTLLMGDVKTGSETPKMASMVLEWRKSNPKRAGEIWSHLDMANANLVNTLSQLTDLAIKSPQSYTQLLQTGIIPSSSNLLLQLRENFAEIRKYLRIMTIESGAQIEPKEQTELLDKCNNIPGVIGGVVPGAGGFDAISLLVLKDNLSDIRRYTRQSNDPVFTDLTWLDLSEQRVGLRKEASDLYEGL